MEHNYNYCLYEKRKNKKYIIAVWYPNTNHTCLANAQDCFEMHGFKTYNNYDLTEYITCQKSFGGYDENYKKFYDTVEDINKFMDEKYRLERIELEKKFKNFNDD